MVIIGVKITFENHVVGAVHIVEVKVDDRWVVGVRRKTGVERKELDQVLTQLAAPFRQRLLITTGRPQRIRNAQERVSFRIVGGSKRCCNGHESKPGAANLRTNTFIICEIKPLAF